MSDRTNSNAYDDRCEICGNKQRSMHFADKLICSTCFAEASDGLQEELTKSESDGSVGGWG